MTASFRLSALQGLDTADQILFQRFGSGATVAPSFRRIHHAIEEQALRCPTAIAAEHLGGQLTYRELDERADRLAGLLIDLGVRPGDRVGLFLTRSLSMVVGILAVLKAGAAYVPQDVRITPPKVLRQIVGTAGIRVVLTTTAHELPGGLGTVVPLDSIPDSTAPRKARSCGETAMVIFTSGTTGQPNGVQVTHANLCNVLLTEPGSLGIRPGDRVGQLLNIAFDMAAWEILGTLSHGGTLVIRGEEITRTAATLNVVIATPSVLSTLTPSRCANVHTVAVAGERCPPSLAATWSRTAVFHNSCGPTEVTIVNTVQRYSGTLTIGRPIPNTTVYILDDGLRPCPIGEIGEMWAGGACVTAGYLGNPTLTGERYRPDPFLGGANRMFRTRDLGRWTANGELEHHGRTDDQVKLRGFRVELDAITSAMEQTIGCARASTVLHEDRLIGFVTPATVAPELVRRAIEERLPYYCLPTLIVPVDRLPMTDRGKVDRRALLSRLETVA
ncbi:amino acid adenylation domain-containing protein [Amycolatopsis orientalis]|uniref:amino acid adenylation domain-containing protein n=1 Tax=Amycolatopsis orientalis TaxID=31958 RepID=UPI0003FDF3A8|nr:amino acid adenylation domain-containing protein [Amycolatopsis orientalis]